MLLVVKQTAYTLIHFFFVGHLVFPEVMKVHGLSENVLQVLFKEINEGCSHLSWTVDKPITVGF